MNTQTSRNPHLLPPIHDKRQPVIVMLLYPGLTLLDLLGPQTALSTSCQVHLVWKTKDLIVSDSGITLQPTTTIAECPRDVDAIFVGGGPGQDAIMTDPEILGFLADIGSRAKYVTSVCGGSLVLGAAGLMKGYRAGSHWACLDALPLFGATPVNQRVVTDRNRISGGGVTAGLDFGLVMLEEMLGKEVAQMTQLALEYDPQPPYDCGTPEKAGPILVEKVKKWMAGVDNNIHLASVEAAKGIGSQASTVTLKKVASNGTHIHVAEQGSGELALVFLPYWGGSTRTWKYVTESLSNSYRTIAADNRGWGKSDAPKEGYSMSDHADDVLGVINSLGLLRYIIVGHSMGGKIAQVIASRRPEGLAGLILVGSSLPIPLVVPPEMRAMMINAYSTRENVEASIDQVLTARQLSPEDREQVIEDSLCGAPPAKEAWPILGSQEDICKAAANINVRTLIIAAELDRVDSVEATKKELLPRIPGAILKILPGTGHLAPLESPEELSTMIDEFIRSLNP
jgi:pimeloyl-ACP methyl ester carboxylesterase/putative intracellular protease/amidase